MAQQYVYLKFTPKPSDLPDLSTLWRTAAKGTFSKASGATDFTINYPAIRVSGTNKLTVLVRAHGGSGGTIRGLNTGALAKKIREDLGEKVNRIVFLVCHAGNGFGTLTGSETKTMAWGPTNTLIDSGGRMCVGGATPPRAKEPITAAISSPSTKLTAAKGWNSGRVI